MDRTDAYGAEMFPDCNVFDAILAAISPRFYVIQVGKGQPRYKLKNIDLDLSNKTTVINLLDLAKQSSHLIGQVSGIVPLAESFDKKVLTLFASRGLNCSDQRISSILPRKVCHKKTSMHVVDDWSQEKIQDALTSFL